MLDAILLLIVIVLMIVALIGCVVPAIPGPLLAYGALWVFYASELSALSIEYMLTIGAITTIVFFADYYLPPLITKKFGGTKYAVWGSIIGMLLGMFIPPIGLLIGMLVGAFMGEILFAKKSGTDSIISTLGTFLGFLVGTGLKLLLCFYILYVVIAQSITSFG